MLKNQYKNFLFDIQDEVLTLTLSREKFLNALNRELLTELKHFLDQLRDVSFSEIRGVIVTGAGEKAFVAGADIKEMASLGDTEGAALSQLGQEVMNGFENLPFPVIACVDGFALGGGCELALGCDWIYATEKSIFGLPEVSLGLLPAFGGTQRLMRRVGMHRAKEWIFTGDKIKAIEAFEQGLVSKVFSDKNDMFEYAKSQIKKVKKQSALAVAKSKQVIDQTEGLDMTKGLKKEAEGFGELFQSQDKKIGFQAFLNKEKPHFTYPS